MISVRDASAFEKEDNMYEILNAEKHNAMIKKHRGSWRQCGGNNLRSAESCNSAGSADHSWGEAFTL